MSDVLVATFVRLNTMAGGDVRIVLDMQCSLSEIAAMGLVPGVPFALARLTNGAAAILPNKEQEEKPKGGELAKLAGILCAEPTFWEFLLERHGSLVQDAHEAAKVVRRICRVDSRADLDHDQEAAHTFHELIRKPYVEWQRENLKED